MSDLHAKLMAAFEAECREHLEHVRSALPQLSNVSGSKESLDESFRRAHSLKGAARAVGIADIEVLAHRLETLFSRTRKGGMVFHPVALETTEKALDAIEDVAVCAFEGGPPPDTSAVRAQLDALIGDTDTSAGTAESEVPDELPAEDARAEVPPAGEAAEATPAAEAGIADTVRVRTRHLDQLLRTTAQVNAEVMQQDRLCTEMQQIWQTAHDLQAAWDRMRRASPLALRRLREDPELSGLARFLDTLEQHLHTLSRESALLGTAQRRNARSLCQLTEQVQEDVREARMVPAQSVFGHFRKMVRDLARDQGKEVRFETSGLALVADRTVLQTLKDPLMHLLRNAVYHGIENPQERETRGKPRTGTIGFSIRTGGGRLVVQVKNDGRGVDIARVTEKAAAAGLISEAPVDDNLARLHEMLFEAGFSTAEEVTEISGRGMGMSVVKHSVHDLQGDVALDTMQTGGLVVTIDVPLSVTLQRLLLVECRNATYAVPLHAIERLLRSLPEEIRTIEGQPVLDRDGSPCPVVNLAAVLDPYNPALTLGGERIPLLVLRGGGRRLALAVDCFVAETDSVVKRLGVSAGETQLFSGTVLLGDGRVALVLNPASLLDMQQSFLGRPFEVVESTGEQTRTPTILVVDDSFTTRTLEKSVLEAQGYQVQVAVDGADALRKMQVQEVDLVISDIQMPNLDGFALLEGIKTNQRLKEIPVIIVSSLEDRKDQERGLALGADAYVVKRKFDQRDLLETIEQVL